jgi:hypothetical protein
MLTYSGSGGYACRNGQTVYNSISGTPHWNLSLRVRRAFAHATCQIDQVGIIGSKAGGVKRFDNVGGGLGNDPRNPAVDLAACPPYAKIGADTYCTAPELTLLSVHNPTVLRWTKPVDCEADFEGDPISLTLDSPRFAVDSGDGDCECMDYEINADKFGITGFNTTAVITPVYI